jgi:hypothetical protein
MDSGIADGATLMEANKGLVAHIFGTACERHKLTTEAQAARVFGYIAPALADLLRRFEDLNRQISAAAERAERHR